MTNLVELIRARSQETPEATAYIYLEEGETESGRLTYRELEQRCREVAALLQEQGVGVGDRALLLYPPGLDYVVAFFGCLFAGAVAVPAYPPRPRGSMTRLDAIAADARAVAALTTSSILAGVRQQLGGGFDARVESWMATDDLAPERSGAWVAPELSAATLAFLQYTSGSTSTPKGVMVSHGNLISNERMIQEAFGHDEGSTFVGWLPMFHDMGLIGNVIQPLFIGAPSVLMSPLAFVQKPLRWLRAISEYRGFTSGGPNFAYDLCVAKTTPEDREGLDLSSWTVAFNGAEPVRGETLDRFVTAFSPWGFRRAAFQPVYGLAEATLLVSGSGEEPEPTVVSFSAADLEQGRATPVSDPTTPSRSLVSCGRTWLDQTIEIVDPETRGRCVEGEIGEIWVAGENVAHGYWNRDQVSAETFGALIEGSGDGPFLRTGDLGFVHDGELFISGRIKDLIIIRGRNHFPQDIELTAENSHPGLRRGCTAAFSVDESGEERLVVVQEVRREARHEDLSQMAIAIRQAITKGHELSTHAVVLLKPSHIPKTSSGKIQRHACRRLYLEDGFDALLVSRLGEESAADDRGVAAPEATLLRQTLRALGLEGGSAVLEAHLRERASAPSEATSIDSVTWARIQRDIEKDLDLSLSADLVEDASGFASLARELVDLLLTDGVVSAGDN